MLSLMQPVLLQEQLQQMPQHLLQPQLLPLPLLLLPPLLPPLLLCQHPAAAIVMQPHLQLAVRAVDTAAASGALWAAAGMCDSESASACKLSQWQGMSKVLTLSKAVAVYLMHLCAGLDIRRSAVVADRLASPRCLAPTFKLQSRPGDQCLTKCVLLCAVAYVQVSVFAPTENGIVTSICRAALCCAVLQGFRAISW